MSNRNLPAENWHIRSGADSADDSLVNQPGGSIVFFAGNDEREVLRFAPNGDFIHEGRVVTQDRELYEMFVNWLKGARIERELKPAR